jgi:hypothetical protein
MKNSLKIFIGLVILGACKKTPEPISYTNEPIYFLRGTIEGSPKELIAGKEKIYLYTDYTTDSISKALVFKGRFKQNCTECKEELSIEWLDYKENDIFNPDSSFKNGVFQYALTNEANISNYNLKLKANPSGIGTINKQNWEINGVVISDSNEVNRNFLPGTIVNLKYVVSYGSCQSSIEYKMKFAPQMKPGDLPEIHHMVLDTAQQMFKLWATGIANAQYYWNMGDGTKLKGNTVYYGYKSKGVYPISLLQVENGDTSEVKYVLKVGENNDCTANFTPSVTAVLNPNNFATLKLVYTNERGDQFYSNEIKQSIDAKFAIINNNQGEIQIPQKNNRNVEIVFSCKLKGKTGVLEFRNWKGKMAFGHP